MSDENRKVAYEMALSAGIELPEKRAAAMAAARERTLEAVARLLRIQYGETEPAPRFRPPGSGTA